MNSGAAIGRGVFLELVAPCNEACTHCYADASPQRAEFLSDTAISAILPDAKALGFSSVQLTGGDPLIAPGFRHALSTAHAPQFGEIEVFCNGLALTPALADEISACGARMAFSVYSHDPPVHDAITRTPKSHARTMRAIRCVKNARSRFDWP